MAPIIQCRAKLLRGIHSRVRRESNRYHLQMAASEKLTAGRNEMLLEQLYRRGITSQRVLDVMAKVPRERFLPAELESEAYADRALSIDCGQTISQPYIVGLMTQALELSGSESVLEIGTGSGYQTAILAELARSVVSMERHADLSAHAGTVLAELGYTNVTLVVGDGTLGWPQLAPYDRIIAAAAATDIPIALFEQLAEGGILVIPLGSSENQMLQAIRKLNDQPIASDLSGCRFVPFVGAQHDN